MTIKIYHNPRCTKSRETLQLLERRGIKPQVVLYLEKPPSKNEIVGLLKLLKLEVRDIIRKNEDEYKANHLHNQKLSDEKLIEFIVKNPKLLERPIVVNGTKAAIGRPPENVLKIL